MPEQIVGAEKQLPDESPHPMELGQVIGSMIEELQDMARREMARQRRGLGELSTEQEHAVEDLLISTIDKISNPVIEQMRQSVDAGQ